jgi:RNA polymerase-binding transcription factor DksA
MLRILILIVLIWILYAVFKRFIASLTVNKTNSHQSSSEKIVACNACGLHIPETEIHMVDGAVYCNNPDCQPKTPNKR